MLYSEDSLKLSRLSEASDAKNTVDLFGGFIEQTETQNLKTEQAFVDYAKKIADILAQEDRKKYIQEFMKELLQQIYPKLTSLEYEVIISIWDLERLNIFPANSLQMPNPLQPKAKGRKGRSRNQEEG